LLELKIPEFEPQRPG